MTVLPEKVFFHGSSSSRKVRRILHISGGKDSGAMYLFAKEQQDRHGMEFECVFADTGNEHEATLEYVNNLPRMADGPKITWVRADFSSRIAKRRTFVSSSSNYSNSARESVLQNLRPTGNPFLDLCCWKGRFPSSYKRFCTVELKIIPAREQYIDPLLDAGYSVESWQGVRAEESAERAKLPKRSLEDENLVIVRPLLNWSIEKVKKIYRRHNVPMNPLYKLGMFRVGCMPCIMACKEEIFRISKRFPDHIDRIRQWESIVSKVSRMGASTFFHKDGMSDEVKANRDLIFQESGIDGMVRWSRTTRGGKQFDLLKTMPLSACQSEYGLCE